MTRIWLVNWYFQSRITLWCRHKSTNVSMGSCWQMPKFIVWRLWSIYFDHHLPLKPSIGKRRKQSCTPNIYNNYLGLYISIIQLYYTIFFTKVFDNVPMVMFWSNSIWYIVCRCTDSEWFLSQMYILDVIFSYAWLLTHHFNFLV